jgi:hypothetical protein
MTKGWDDGAVLTEAMLDDIKSSTETFLNTTKLDSNNLQSGGIATANYAAGSVDAAALGTSAVTTAKINDGAVTTDKLGASAVTAAKVTDATLTPAKFDSSQYGGKYAYLRNAPSSGTNGGTFTSGAWRTRELDSEVTDDIGITLSSNEFSLPAGTYRIEARAPAFQCNHHKARLYNVTDASATIIGSTANAGAADNIQTDAWVRGVFTIAGTKTFRIEHICETTSSTTGLGTPGSFSVVEVYCEVELWKIKN